MQGNGPAPTVKSRGPRPQGGGDPVIRWVTFAIFAVIIIWLAAVVSALMFGVLRPTGAPRTSTERDLDYYSSLTQTGKATMQQYGQYIETLIRAGQLSRAQDELNRAVSQAKKDKSYLYAEQASLDYAHKNYQNAAEAADKAMTEAQKELKAFEDANVAANRRKEAGAVMPQSFSDAALIKANSLVASKDSKDAVKAFDAYLKLNSTDSDVLVARGSAKADSGDKAGAEADFRMALKFIPDYQPALNGLKKIGAK